MITDLLRGLSERRTRAKAARHGDGLPTVAVEYAPRHDGDADPGEVVWTWVPYEDDATQGKDRPVVIIGRLGHDLAAIALTTKGHGPPGDRVAVGTGDWDREGRPSFAKIDRILAVDATQVRREGAAFDRARFEVLVAAVRARNPSLVVRGGVAA